MSTDGSLRYAVLIPGWGAEIQQRLTERHVFVAGARRPRPASIYLAATGVGRLTVVGVDVVEASNLNRFPDTVNDDAARNRGRLMALYGLRTDSVGVTVRR